MCVCVYVCVCVCMCKQGICDNFYTYFSAISKELSADNLIELNELCNYWSIISSTLGLDLETQNCTDAFETIDSQIPNTQDDNALNGNEIMLYV